MLAQVLIPVRDPESTLAILLPGALRRHEQIVRRAARGLRRLRDRIGNRLAVEPRQRWLRIEQIDVARPAFHEEPDYRLGHRRMVGLLRREWVLGREKIRQRDAGQPASGAREKLTPC